MADRKPTAKRKRQQPPRLVQEAARVKRYIRRDGLVGLMNIPKWRRLITALAPFALRFRCQWVDVDEPSRWMPALTVVGDANNNARNLSEQYLDSLDYGPVGSFEVELRLACLIGYITL